MAPDPGSPAARLPRSQITPNPGSSTRRRARWSCGLTSMAWSASSSGPPQRPEPRPPHRLPRLRHTPHPRVRPRRPRLSGQARRNARRHEQAASSTRPSASSRSTSPGNGASSGFRWLQRGPSSRRAVWGALQQIPYGCTISYKTLAERIGRPAAVRAVGLANGRNPLPIVIPCHRVIGHDGSLTGYGGGLGIKRILLELERPGRSPAEGE